MANMNYCFNHDIFQVICADGNYYCPKCEMEAGRKPPKGDVKPETKKVRYAVFYR